jgi:diguanylate cyclase (GGDEF)-like protein
MDPLGSSDSHTRPHNGMAASDTDSGSHAASDGQAADASALALRECLAEEIDRAGRDGTALSCLLLRIEDLEELRNRYGSELPDQALDYVEATLRGELRRSDQIGRPSYGELLVILPGADGPQGEIVARRVLERLRTVKVEADGQRRSLRISVSLAVWRAELSGDDLLAQTRSAAVLCSGNGSSPPVRRPSS